LGADCSQTTYFLLKSNPFRKRFAELDFLSVKSIFYRKNAAPNCRLFDSLVNFGQRQLGAETIEFIVFSQTLGPVSLLNFSIDGAGLNCVISPNF
jgi:hypothetical protein